MKPFAAFRRSSTGPSSMLRQPEAFNRLRVEALSVGNLNSPKPLISGAVPVGN
jgi:hypothetical protein